ncbi:hypothetical protein [uncultured Duncaniella sp.]|nr:hypothetical protein [uncultured Duncaniella sp.]
MKNHSPTHTPHPAHLRATQFRPAGFIASRSMRGYHRIAAAI